LLRPVDIDLTVRQEALALALDDTIARFGLGHTGVTVALPQGAPLDSVLVALTKAGGSVAPTNLWITPSRPGSARFWSGGGRGGQIIATAMSRPYAVTTRDIVYVWPVGFIVAIVLGALAGGTATLVFRSRVSSRRGAILLFGGALVTGTLAAIAGAVLGVKVGTFEPAAGGGLALVFVLSLVGAWLGPRLFRLFGASLG